MTGRKFLGIYGGTFDPIHLGHISAATEVAHSLNIDEVRMLLSATPPHRLQPVLSAKQRFELLSQALQGQSLLIADDSEMLRVGFSYMVDSLTAFRKQLQKQPLALILGIDAFNGLKSWHRWQDIIKLAHIVVTDRAESDIDLSPGLADFVKKHQVFDKCQLQQQASGLLYIQKVTPRAISSTKIKQTIKQGCSADALLPASVAKMINKNGFYKADN